tara:strand:- start:62 stop:679 length:618 start_codon:yes stop_codon:yes gene_type:complete
MKLNENFSECLLGLKECISNHKEPYERYERRKEKRFYAAMFQVEAKDFLLPFQYCKTTSRKLSEKLLEINEYKDLYLITDFLDKDQADHFSHHQYENQYSTFGNDLYFHQSALQYFRFIRSELGYKCRRERKEEVDRFVIENWGEDYANFVEINRGVDYIADYWRAERYSELNKSKVEDIQKVLSNSSTAKEMVDIVKHHYPNEE